MNTLEFAKRLAISEESTRKTNMALNKLVDLFRVFEPVKKEEPVEHPFQTGVQTISTATSEGTYPVTLDFMFALDKPSTSGFLTNYGEGNIYIKFSVDRISLSVEEVKLLPWTRMKWTNEKIYYIHLRTDKDGTQYQCEAT